jgi:two-component system, response regulator, stage 0 sporulation protein A
MTEIEVLRYDIIELKKAISELTDLLGKKPIEEPQDKPTSLDKQISDILLSYRIPVHIKGYRYLKEAIKMEVETYALAVGVTKHIYPTIALQHKDVPTRVERAIRHAIELGWKGQTLPKPTNSQFIALVAEKIRMEREQIA